MGCPSITLSESRSPRFLWTEHLLVQLTARDALICQILRECAKEGRLTAEIVIGFVRHAEPPKRFQGEVSLGVVVLPQSVLRSRGAVRDETVDVRQTRNHIVHLPPERMLAPASRAV